MSKKDRIKIKEAFEQAKKRKEDNKDLMNQLNSTNFNTYSNASVGKPSCVVFITKGRKLFVR